MISSYRDNENRTLTLEHERHGLRQTFTLTDTHLAVEWRSGESRGRSEHALRDVSPDVAYFEGKAAGDPVAVERCMVAGGLAIVVAFSTVHEHVPLLAPFLFVLAALQGMRALRARGHSTWSVIQHADGRQLATIDHAGCDATRLAELLDALRERAAVRSGAPLERDPPVAA